MQCSSDAILWNKFRNGDKQAFQSIYRMHAPALLNYGRKIIADSALVEDSIQDLFVELWKSGRNLSPTTSIKFYLFRSLRWKILRNNNRSHQNETVGLDSCMRLLKDSSDEDRLVEIDDSYRVQILKETVQKLPARQREAINLRYYHNFLNEEVAQIMGVNYNSACKLIYAGLKNLKQHLKVAVSLIFCVLTGLI